MCVDVSVRGAQMRRCAGAQVHRCVRACMRVCTESRASWVNREANCSVWPWRLISNRGNTREDGILPSALAHSLHLTATVYRILFLSPSPCHSLSFHLSLTLPTLSSFYLSCSCFIPDPNYSFYFSNYICHLSSSLICHMMITFCPSLHDSHISHDQSHGPILCAIFLFQFNLLYVSIWSALKLYLYYMDHIILLHIIYSIL